MMIYICLFYLLSLTKTKGTNIDLDYERIMVCASGLVCSEYNACKFDCFLNLFYLFDMEKCESYCFSNERFLIRLEATWRILTIDHLL